MKCVLLSSFPSHLSKTAQMGRKRTGLNVIQPDTDSRFFDIYSHLKRENSESLFFKVPFGIFQSGCIINLAGCIVLRARGFELKNFPGLQASSVLQLLLPASAGWARMFPWYTVVKLFGCAWGTVASAVKVVVDYGLKHRDLSSITHIGIDEISRKGIFYQCR